MTTWTIRRRPDGRWAAISLDPTGGRHIITYPNATAAMTALDPRNRPTRQPSRRVHRAPADWRTFDRFLHELGHALTTCHDRSHYTLEA